MVICCGRKNIYTHLLKNKLGDGVACETTLFTMAFKPHTLLITQISKGMVGEIVYNGTKMVDEL